MRPTTNKMSRLPSSFGALLLGVASGCWLPACGDDDAAPPRDAGADASDTDGTDGTDGTDAPDAAAPTDTSEPSTDTSSVSTEDESKPGAADAGRDASDGDAADASPWTDTSAPTTTTGTDGTSDTSETSGTDRTSDTSETSSGPADAGSDAGAGAPDGAIWDAAPDADAESMPWDANAFDIGPNETRVLTDFDTDGDAPSVAFFGPPATVDDLLLEVEDSIGSFTIPFTEPAQALRVQLALPGNYATHELRVRLRVAETLPNNPDAEPTLELFSYSGGGSWNSLALPIDPGVWHEYSYDLYEQPVFPDQLDSVGFRVGAGDTLETPDSFVVEIDWVRLEPRP